MLLQSPDAQIPTLNPIELMLGSSGIVLVVLLILVAASTGVWAIWLLKATHLHWLRATQYQFERKAKHATHARDLIAAAYEHRNSPGGRVVMELAKRLHQPRVSSQLLGGIAKRAIASEQQRASSLMPTLSSIASASPFVGLFGTVWGIMDAFLRIGVEKSASLPVVAPAIGEALIATAFGLVAAIPATVGFNFIENRIGELMEELSASAEIWALTLAVGSADPVQAQPQQTAAQRGIVNP